jgi:hypothetical protein
VIPIVNLKNATGYQGVMLKAGGQTFRADLFYRGSHHHILQTFDSPFEAGRMHGESLA